MATLNNVWPLGKPVGGDFGLLQPADCLGSYGNSFRSAAVVCKPMRGKRCCERILSAVLSFEKDQCTAAGGTEQCSLADFDIQVHGLDGPACSSSFSHLQQDAVATWRDGAEDEWPELIQGDLPLATSRQMRSRKRLTEGSRLLVYAANTYLANNGANPAPTDGSRAAADSSGVVAEPDRKDWPEANAGLFLNTLLDPLPGGDLCTPPGGALPDLAADVDGAKEDKTSAEEDEDGQRTTEVDPLDGRIAAEGRHGRPDAQAAGRRAPVHLPSRTQRVVLEALLALSSARTPVVHEALDPWAAEMTREDASSVIRELGLKGRADLALKVFRWMEKQRKSLLPNMKTYSIILGVLGRAGKTQTAADIFKGLLTTRESSEMLHAYNAMLSAYGRARLWTQACSILQQMRARGCQPDRVTYNTLIGASVRCGNPAKKAVALFERMKRDGMQPDVRTFNLLISALSKEGSCEEASQVFDEMDGAGCTPDIFTFNTLIAMFGRAGRPEDAFQVFERVTEAGLEPDIVTYTALMSAFSSAGMPAEAMEIFEQMQAVGCKPDLRAYCQLMNVHKLAGLPREAEAVMSKMKSAGHVPNTIAYSTLVQAYGRLGMLDEAARVFQEMRAAGCPADVTLYNILMDAYGHEGLSIKAASLFRRMQSEGLVPDAVSYNTLIHAHCQAGQTEEARRVHEDMIEARCRPDKITQGLLGRAYGRASIPGYPDETYGLGSLMRQ